MNLILIFAFLFACLTANQVSAEVILERKLFLSLFSNGPYQTPKDVLNRLNVLNYIYTNEEPSRATNEEKQLVFDLLKLPLIETCSKKNKETFEKLLRSQRHISNIFNFVKNEQTRFLKKCYKEGETYSQLNEQQKLLDLFYSDNDAPTLLVFQTKNYLESLRDLYLGESGNFAASLEMRDLVLRLTKLTEEAPCFDETVYDKYDDLRRSQADRRRIVEFVDHYREAHLFRCRNEFMETYHEHIASIPILLQLDLSELSDEIKYAAKEGFNNVRPFYSQEELARGIREFLVEKSVIVKSSVGNKKNGLSKEDFITEYKSRVEVLCESLLNLKSKSDNANNNNDENENKIGRNFKSMSKFLIEQVTDSDVIMKDLDETTKGWLIKSNICIDVINEDNRLAERVWELMNCKKKKSGGATKFLCFFKPNPRE